MSTATPVSALNQSDPGDVVARKFRYQYAYGVILWAACLKGHRDYTALWCEQHEDFLGQVSDVLFDAFQIKTQKDGAWQWNHEEVYNSVKRFVHLDEKYPGQLRTFYFVSNTECSTSLAEDKIHLSMRPVLELLKGQAYGPYPEYCETCLNNLAKRTECERGSIAAVVRRMWIEQGPPESSVEAEIKVNHLWKVPKCGHLGQNELTELFEALVGRLWKASSKSSQDPSRHYAIFNGRLGDDPQLREKRIEVTAFTQYVDEFRLPRFEYMRRFRTINLQGSREDTSILEQKLAGAGLADYFESLRRQTLSTERNLIELQAKEGERADKIIAQMESVVLRVCDDAHLRHVDPERPNKEFGVLMMRDVNAELKAIVEKNSGDVYGQTYEALLGMSGLLAEECKVWWSKRFKLEGKK